MPATIPTTFFVISDTHGQALEHKLPAETVDVAIHCGDLTEESKLPEFRTTLETLDKIQATLKLVIAGNHDWTLDDHAFKQKLTELKRIYGDSEDMDAIIKHEYGSFGEARAMMHAAKTSGIIFLEEGMHNFTLYNGSRLKVFASPFTPSTNDWGFQYDPASGRRWDIDKDVNIVITHSPPRGILDTSDGIRAGCPDLFKAVARARPRMHCYGHIHNGWGAKLVTWRETPTEEPSHFTDIDGSGTRRIEDDKSLKVDDKKDSAMLLREKHTSYDKYQKQGYCDYTDTSDHVDGSKTIFVNAALENKDGPQRFPWLIKLGLQFCNVEAPSGSAPSVSAPRRSASLMPASPT